MRTEICGDKYELKNYMISNLRSIVPTFRKYTSICRVRVKVKGKAIPLQTWTGPEGSRRLRLTDL
jgi:hypothetical protein